MSRLNPRFQPFSSLRRPRRARLAAACAVVLAIAACTDDAVTGTGTGTTSTQVASVSPIPGMAQAHPATPTPAAVPSPVRQAPAEVATPVPAGGATTPAPTATASALDSVGASTAPGASPGASPSPSPSPSASPSYKSTGVATDLYIAGPAYFLLSNQPAPTAIEDLIFTRNGHFKTKVETVSGLSVHRIVHADDESFYLLGFTKAGASTSTNAPDEASGVSEAVLTLNWGGAATVTQPLTLDADRNAGADTKLSFTSRGLLRMSEADPRTGAGDPLTAYVALAEVEHPEALVAVPAFTGFYRFNANAGTIFTGVAYSGANRPVGSANLIKPAYLEE